MPYLYLTCLIISIGMLFWLKAYDVQNSTTQLITILIIVVSNFGFYSVSISRDIGEAILAQKIAYVGGIFLPAFYFLLVLEICQMTISKYVGAVIMIIQCVLYGLVCSIGHNSLFYKTIESEVVNGYVILKKEYGVVHTIYLISMSIYLFAAFVVAFYSLAKKKSVDRRSAITMLVCAFAAVIIYAIEKILHIEIELMPIVYIVFLIGTLFPVYDYNTYTVYKNQDVINEQLEKVGFLTFNTSHIYKGCDEYMACVFPELKEFQLGKKIDSCSPELEKLISQLTKIEGLNNNSREHQHVELDPFIFNGRYYIGAIHEIKNSFGKLKGYTIELNDDTANHRALELKERYNEELSQEVDEKTKRIRKIQQRTILGMAQMVESRDLSTGGHIKRTSDVVRVFSKKLVNANLDLSKKFLHLVIRSAPMHDIGKIGVDDAILRKQGRFTDEEYDAMKKHAEIGYKMVSEILADVEEPDFVRVAENVAHYHHEKVNGMGYPTGIKGDDIPVEARIMALADVFDALVSKRCYKDAFSYDEAFEIIKKDSGTHFDAKLAEVFLSCRPELEAYYNKCDK